MHDYWLLLWKSHFWWKDWTLCTQNQFWGFSKISYFSKIISPKMFRNLQGNSYTETVILDIKLVYVVNCQNIMTRIAGLNSKIGMNLYSWGKYFTKCSVINWKITSTVRCNQISNYYHIAPKRIFMHALGICLTRT